MKTQIHRWLLLLVFLLTPLLRAQDSDIPWVKTELSIICWNAEMALSYPGYQGDSPIIAPMQMRSRRIQYEGPAIFTLTGAPTIDGMATAPVANLSNVELRLKTPQQLLILLPVSNGEMPYRTLVIDDSFDKFPPQSIRFMNFTDNTYTGQLGAEHFYIDSRNETIVTPHSLKPPKYLTPLRLARQIETDQSTRPVKSTILQLHDNMRILILLLQDPQRPFEVKFVLLRDESHRQPVEQEVE